MPVIFDSSESKKKKHKEQKKEKHCLFHSFCVFPSVRFVSQYKKERVVLLLREHPITQAPWLIVGFFFSLLPLFINVLLANTIYLRELIFLNIFWYSLVFSYMFVHAIKWLFNVGIVTNERIIDVDYHFILQREISEAANFDITDVTVRTSGFIPTLFGYGDILVQTVGTTQDIEFFNAPKSSKAISIISKLASQAHNVRKRG